MQLHATTKRSTNFHIIRTSRLPLHTYTTHIMCAQHSSFDEHSTTNWLRTRHNVNVFCCIAESWCMYVCVRVTHRTNNFHFNFTFSFPCSSESFSKIRTFHKSLSPKLNRLFCSWMVFFFVFDWRLKKVLWHHTELQFTKMQC